MVDSASKLDWTVQTEAPPFVADEEGDTIIIVLLNAPWPAKPSPRIVTTRWHGEYRNDSKYEM